MPRRGFQEGAPQGGMAQFTAGAPPAAPPTVATDYSGIQQALAGFTRISMERDARQAEADAVVAQEIAGVSGLAQPDRFMLPSAARAFERRAQAVYSQQLQTEATATAAELLRNHLFDPEGFDNAWNAYTEGKLKALQDDPVFASQVGLALNDMGVKQRTQIETNVFERTQQGIAVEMISSLQQQQNAIQDQLLTYPNEALTVESIAMLEERIAEIDEVGILAPKQIGDLRAQLNDALYGAFVEGKIRESLESGDMATLQTLHYNLQRGAYFDDNQQALRFAGRIASSMGGDVSRGEINAFKDIGRVLLSRTQSGMELTSEEVDALDQAFNFIQAYGTEEDQRTFSQNYVGVALTQQFTPLLQNGSIDDIGAALVELRDLSVELASPQVVAGLRSALLERQTELRALADLGDLAAIGTSAVWGMSVSELMSASDDVRAQFALAQQYNRELAAQRRGVDPRQVMPWTFAQRADFAEQLKVAHASEDAQLYGRLHDMYLAAFGDDIFSAVKFMADESESLAGAMYIGYVLADDSLGSAAEIQNLALMGAQMRNVPANQAAFENILQRGAAYTDVVYALSAGSGALNNAVTESISNAMLALQVTGTQPRDAKTFIEARLDAIDVQTLRNSTLVVPNVFSRSPGVATNVLSQAEQFLEENKMALGNQYAQLVPVPAGDGVARLKNLYTGYPLREPDGVTVVEFRVEREEFEAIVQEEFASAQEAIAQAEIALENRVNMNSRERDLLVSVGTKAGMSEDEAFNYYRAVSFSPATSMTNLPNGISPMMQQGPIQTAPDRPVGRGVSEEAQRAIDFARAAMSEVAPDVRFQPTQTDILRGATVQQYANLLERFGRDQQKALAAMVSSPEEVEAAVEMFGDNWLDAVDLSVQTFVYRGLGFEEVQ